MRRRDPEFAAQWKEAQATVSARIEAELAAHALASIEAAEPKDPAPLDFSELMRLLYYFRSRDKGTKFGPKRRYATPEETDAALMEKLDGLEKRVRARLARERAERRAAREAAKAKKDGEPSPIS